MKDLMTDYNTLLNSARKVTVFTGAGVSTSAGIPDFQSTDDTWSHPLPRAEMMSRPYFNQNPKHFWEVYRDVFSLKMSAETPTLFHQWVADLEQTHEVTVLTQNVDGLHTKAGSSNVLEVHGNATKLICTRLSCQRTYPRDMYEHDPLPRCESCNKLLKPDVVLFYEGLYSLGEAREAVETCDLLIVAGTSLEVGPINQLPLDAEIRYNKQLLWVNPNPYPEDYRFQHTYFGSSDSFAELMNQ